MLHAGPTESKTQTIRWNGNHETLKKKSFGDHLLTFCFCFAVGLFHNPLETFVLGRGDLVPCIPFRMLLVFRACSHEQLVLWIFQHANPHRHKHTSWDCNCKNISHFKGVLPKTSENITTLRCGCLPGCLMRNAFKLWIWFWPFFGTYLSQVLQHYGSALLKHWSTPLKVWIRRFKTNRANGVKSFTWISVLFFRSCQLKTAYFRCTI